MNKHLGHLGNIAIFLDIAVQKVLAVYTTMIEIHYVVLNAYWVLCFAENCEDTGFQVWTCIGVGNFTAG